jgi:antitoxin FitA
MMLRMAIQDIHDELKGRAHHTQHCRWTEDEPRDILQAVTMVGSIRARIEPLGGVDLEIASREPTREPAAVDEGC